MIKAIAKMIKALNSETEPGQISLAICLSMIIGLTPVMNLHNLLVILLVLVLRINLSSFIVFWGIFKAIAYLLDPLFHTLGLSILTHNSLMAFWTTLYNIEFFSLTGFNNSIVMGSLFFSMLLFIPLFITLNMLIKKYREHLLAYVKKTRLAKWLFSSRVYLFYQKVSG